MKAIGSNVSIQKKQRAQTLLKEIEAEANNPVEKPVNKIVSDNTNRRFPTEFDRIFNEACNLYNSGSYADALAKLEHIGKQGHPGALRVIGQAYLDAKGVKQDIGKAYDLFQAAAYRGDKLAVKFIASRLINRDEFGVWKVYAQMKHIDGCEQSHTNGIIAELNRTKHM